MDYITAKKIAALARTQSHNRASYAREMDKIAAFTRKLTPRIPIDLPSGQVTQVSGLGYATVETTSGEFLIGGSYKTLAGSQGFNPSSVGIYLDGSSHDPGSLQNGELEICTLIAVIAPDNENGINANILSVFGPTLPDNSGQPSPNNFAPTPSQCAQAIRNAIALGNTKVFTEGGDPYQAAADGIGIVWGTVLFNGSGGNILGYYSGDPAPGASNLRAQQLRALSAGSCLFGDTALDWSDWST